MTVPDDPPTTAPSTTAPVPTAPGVASFDALLAFLHASPSPYHAVGNVAARLDAAGFTAVDATASWATLPEAAYVASGGSLVAWRRPRGLVAHAPFRVIGAHTDSPNLRIKPRPDTGSAGWRQLAVEIYGGALANSWLDRDLGVSGRVVLVDGSVQLVNVSTPVARVPQLAIHLDREIGERGLLLDKQVHLTPIWGLGSATEGEFVSWLAATGGFDARSVRAWDLMLHDLTPPARLGGAGELLASARLDNLCSTWCAIESLAGAPAADVAQVVCLFDHEEVGSATSTGAGGPALEQLVDRLVHGAGGRPDERARALAASYCISADMAHAVHPNYPERHDPGHRPLPNRGPVLKMNANQRYATDALTAAMFVDCCERAGVPHQVFVSRNNMPCGSTIGPITATRLGIATVDVGCAQLSMHSARELCGADDPALLVRAFNRFYAG